MPAISFEQVAEMASQLAPGEQLKLVAEIGDRLRHALAAADLRQHSVDAVLQAVREPPHLDPAGVDELERTIAAISKTS